jgi:RNase H-like domain found in reverse transcriptase
MQGYAAPIRPTTPAAVATSTELLDRLLSPPVRVLPRTEVHRCLDTDGSDGQLGCCLLQDQPDGKPLPLGFWSQICSSPEHNYSTAEKECFATVWCSAKTSPTQSQLIKEVLG